MAAYYNEIDPYAAQWLRNLIKAGHIAPGDVDERSIVDVRPNDLRAYNQCHFFAGIGVWSLALRRAGVTDAANVWTGSCPCQPFSAAGKGGGFDDERHLWPAFHHLIKECRPSVVIGEQVASKDGLGWLDLVQSDMEGTDYAFGAVDSCSAGFGAPHIRQRLYWMAHSERERGRSRQLGRQDAAHVGLAGKTLELANPGSGWLRRRRGHREDVGQARDICSETREQRIRFDDGADRAVGQLADTSISGRREECPDARRCDVGDRSQGIAPGLGASSSDLRPGPTNGFWRDADWLYCRDGKWRPVEPGTFPLAHGATSRVGRLRAYGNAINAHQATDFVRAILAVAASS